MRLDDVIRGIAITDRRGRFDTEIPSITCDSRRVKEGDLFVAVRGVNHDGHEYISSAVKAGAQAIMAEEWPEKAVVVEEENRPDVVLVPNARRALALAAANFYGQPSRKLLVAGVTGTNGKTTVTYVLESIIRAASKKVGVIGTVDCRYAGVSEKLSHTTPDAVVLQRKLRAMVDAGVTHVVMEVSSHALDQERVSGVHFKVAGFTNLSQEHLDYHKSPQTYFEAKARLFSQALRRSRARGRIAVVNVDDDRGPEILDRWGGKSLRVSLEDREDADVVALSAEYSLDETKATIRTSKGIWDISTPLIGSHNLSNVLAGIGMSLALGLSKARIMRGLRALERVPGRLDPVPNEESKHIFVDYAHTPDALSKTLAALRPLTKGRLIVVFGCGGDRDKGKREPMGKAVAEFSDLAIVTNDNPRSEVPELIADAVQKGLREGGLNKMTGTPNPKTYEVELDRRSAIRIAIEWMNEGDALVIAGKGHETYQIIGPKKIRFDDREEARCILAGLPPPPPTEWEDETQEISDIEVEDVLELAEDDVEVLDEGELTDTQSVEAENILSVDLDPDLVEDAVTVEAVDEETEEKAEEKKEEKEENGEPAPEKPPTTEDEKT